MTKEKIKAEIVDALECEEDFIEHLEKTGLIDKAFGAMNDKAEIPVVMREIFEEWKDWAEDDFDCPPEDDFIPDEEFVDQMMEEYYREEE